MKRLILAFALCASLSACNTSAIQSAGQVAEKGVIGANDLYVGASKAGEALVKMGLYDKARFKAVDASAYQVLLKVQAGQATAQQLQAICTLLAGGK